MGRAKAKARIPAAPIVTDETVGSGISMRPIPRDASSSLTLALEGYPFIRNKARRHGSDFFLTRLFGKRVVCMTGPEAARMFYSGGRFTRRNAMPVNAMTLLQDRGSVQALDGAAHRHRKRMFMSLVDPEAVGRLCELMAEEWRSRLPRWERSGRVVLFPEVEEILCRAVCDWCGVPLSGAELAQKTGWFSAMIDGAGSIGPRNWRGQFRRARAERWVTRIVVDTRAGTIAPPKDSALRAISCHREPDGQLLDETTAAVELINILRPTVAIARYVVYAAIALHDHPRYRERFQEAPDDAELECFVQEVRRLCPFFPFIGGRVLEPFEWKGHRFEPGTWVILDIYGTNLDQESWKDPDAFRPERFRDWDESAFNLIPQGGGDSYETHRCPGERISIELTKTAVRLLTAEMRYRVPPQDLSLYLRRVPALPRSGFVMTDVKQAG